METQQSNKRYFNIDIGITYTVVATSPFEAIKIIHEHEPDFDELLLDYDGLGIREFSEEEAANRYGFDDLRGGGRFPINTFPLGAMLSSEY